MADPDGTFICSLVHRRTIAQDLNEFLEDWERPERFEPGDDRLTDELCAQYAKTLGDLDDGDDEAVYDALDVILQAVGIVINYSQHPITGETE